MTANSNLQQDNIHTKVFEDKLQHANKLFSAGQTREAQVIYQQLLELQPGRTDVMYALGGCFFNNEEHLNALAIFKKLSENEPNNADYRVWFGKSLAANGQDELAIQSYKQALDIDSNNLRALQELGYMYTLKHQNRTSIEYLKRALEIAPSSYVDNGNLAMTLARLGQFEEALKYAEKARRISPKESMIYRHLGEIYLMFGQPKEALQYYHKALSIDPANYIVYYDIVSAEKIRSADDEIIKRMEKNLLKSMKSEQRLYLHFALGKAYNDCKQWDNAFMNFDKANELVHSSFDPKLHSTQIAKAKKIFTTEYFTRHKKPETGDITPIFIVGMPRSGSTLIDQILSSHSMVRSIGESLEIGDIVNKIHAAAVPKKDYPETLRNIPEDQLDIHRKHYIETTKREAEDAEYIVDKMPFNFLHLGLIAVLFPNAKIIHTMRHPLDVGLSCYNTGFGMLDETWTHKLEYIGQYYRDYFDLMEHWRKILPIQILDVQYENVVSDLETNARRILEFCGLEWESGCLEFYKTKRSVVTASLVQVRQPIYSSSVNRWIPYARHLQPLVTALGDVLIGHEAQLIEHGLKPNFKQGLLKRVSAYFQT